MDEQHFCRLRLESCIDYKQFRCWSGCLQSVGLEGKINVASGELLVAHQLQLHACSCRRTLDRFFSGGRNSSHFHCVLEPKSFTEYPLWLTAAHIDNILFAIFVTGSIAELVNWIVDRKVTAEMTGGLTLHKLARIETVR